MEVDSADSRGVAVGCPSETVMDVHFVSCAGVLSDMPSHAVGCGESGRVQRVSGKRTLLVARSVELRAREPCTFNMVILKVVLIRTKSSLTLG